MGEGEEKGHRKEMEEEQREEGARMGGEGRKRKEREKREEGERMKEERKGATEEGREEAEGNEEGNKHRQTTRYDSCHAERDRKTCWVQNRYL